jgi:hypothetical protein
MMIERMRPGNRAAVWLVLALGIAMLVASACGAKLRGSTKAVPSSPIFLAALSHPSPSELRYGTEASSVLANALNLLAEPEAPGRSHYYQAGVFYSQGVDCWRCEVAPGLMVADLAHVFPTQKTYRQLAIATFNAMLQHHTFPNGSFGPGGAGEAGDEIATTEVIGYMGIAYLDLEPWLSATTRRAWIRALRRAGESLEPVLDYYVNGNVNVDNTLAMYLVYRVTGDPSFLAAYQRSFQFTLYPPQSRWPGFGLHFLRGAHRKDDSDGAAYLAEKGSGAPGFDPHYTIVQSAIAAALYAVSGQPRALRLLNLLTNALLTRTDPTDRINVTGGSRRPTFSEGYLESPSLPILALADRRTSLLSLTKAQLQEITVSFHNYAVRPGDENGVMGDFANVLLLFPQLG